MKHNLKWLRQQLDHNKRTTTIFNKTEKELQQLKQQWKKDLPIASQKALIEIDEILGEKQ